MGDEPDALTFNVKQKDVAMGPCGLTKGKIEAANDLLEAMALAEDNNVNIDELESVPEIQSRLICHLKFLTNGNWKEKVERQICEMGNTDIANRWKLSQMVNEVKNVFPKPPKLAQTTQRQSMVEELLLKDGTTEDIREDCKIRLESLANKECVILVSGESSAGKSSLLNLLLGEDILPSHMLPCTSCITVIKYNIYRCAKIIFKNGHMESIKSLDREGLERLQQRAYFSQARRTKSSQEIYAERKEEHDVAEIQVYLPLEMLKSGLVLVDTPGIGESEFLENYLIEYIKNHQILGFMYIIMTDNALGIAEDRLINLMSLIIKSQKNSSNVIKFNPKAALFICNRWDMVSDDNKEAVRDNALKQLAISWPDFDPKLAVFFSTRNALREQHVNPGYVTDEFVALLHGLLSLVTVSLDKRIQASYRWLGTVLQRSVHYLRTVVRQLELNGRDRQKRSHETTKKLNTLEKKADGVVKQLTDDLNHSVNDVCETLKVYLQTHQVKTKLTQKYGSKEGELPDMDRASGTWEWVKRHIDTAFDNRLTDVLEEWDRENEEIKRIEKRIFREAKLQLCDLEGEITEIEKSSQEKHETLSLSKSGVFLNNLCQSIEDFEEDLLFESNVSKKLLTQLTRRIGKTIKKKKEETKLKEFASHPGKTAHKRAEKLYAQTIKDKDDRLNFIVRQFLMRPANYVQKLKEKIPLLISSNKQLQAKFESEVIEEVKGRENYQGMMVSLETIRSTLVTYGENHVFCNDFENEDIEIIQVHKTSVKSGRMLTKRDSLSDLMRDAKSNPKGPPNSLPHGVWHTVFIGKVIRGSESQFIAVKIYSGRCKVENAQHEVAKLRCLLHNDVCIAEFLGVHARPESPTPALIFAGKLQSVKNYIKTHFKVDMSQIFRDLLAGLHYIHSKGLVHMELTKYTVTVGENGDVKLTGTCLPRLAIISPRPGDLVQGWEYMYLAPEVLEGALYISNADIYAFALLVLELKHPDLSDVYKDRREMKIDEISRIPAPNYQKSIEELDYPDAVKQSLLKCLSVKMEERPNVIEMSSEFKYLDRPLRRNTVTPSAIFKLRRH
ncbi:uncharacterized protein LOC128217340 isoform X1 [Mya arenaria]|uniref:uncharacterized protein LOC128217340 isoform X1 n=1 Tax=Mya arenaria TaxID=6604 RepID=UPI0022DF47D9|nr:uncharacterized protein LOC128217340 isoform X1 [Mya arenaria]XP_052780394.1 uncharacterized protein LOC128217340 isoform X1 [Mya arenaria]